VRALVFERSVPRYAAAMLASRLSPGGGARVGPLRLATDHDEPELPGGGWRRVRPRLSGICGSDLATIDGHSSRYFEPIVSFPFVPGHEVVGTLDDGSRVVIEPVLACAARGIDPPCPPCAAGDNGGCHNIAFGHLEPGLQTGFCESTGGGWSTGMVAHQSQIHPVPGDLSDEDAVMVEPAACAVHAVSSLGLTGGETVAVIGAGTLGLLCVAALAALPDAVRVMVAAKHPHQRDWARKLGAEVVVDPGELTRAVRRHRGAMFTGSSVAGGAEAIVDCVGSSDSLRSALEVAGHRATIALVGMPGSVQLDLTPLWHREIRLAGAYAYRHDTFPAAFDLVRRHGLGQLVSATYPLDRYADAVAHAAAAGRRGAVKIAFDLRDERPH
jgi:threonine dehydrogenase-like Zn-dependent dehydrogenase